ncbi:putative DNA helicase [Roseobacter sp. AzwK-3b]|nr:putative DNA helicase [Roseobacter sp. AzwK-3b]
MTFRIADSFSDALARLTPQEQKAVKTAAFDLQMSPDNPGLSMHRVDRARDKGFWTARVNRDIRLVLHKTGGDTLLAWVLGILEDIPGVFRAHDPGAGKGEGHAGGVNRDPAAAPLFGDISGRAGTAGGIKHEVSGVSRYQQAPCD